jgi:hypothetical protein
MSNARDNILARLRANRRHESATPPVYLPDYGWSQEQMIERLSARLRAVRTEVHRLPRE